MDIHFALNALQEESTLNLEEWEKLDGQKRSLEKLLQKTVFQEETAQECLYFRDKRQEIDLVHDAPERALLAVRGNKSSPDRTRCLLSSLHNMSETHFQLGFLCQRMARLRCKKHPRLPP
ncbi:unnamed protein product [Dibothriocephalus latus]|uniref:Uncharacterized protein n=1 Tax=Dibothriocephalus latus TaxID=60516 RepID=A0A3P7LSI5_DIBLA|nr:unnamed protein product [Dibothriocephalus latus]